MPPRKPVPTSGGRSKVWILGLALLGAGGLGWWLVPSRQKTAEKSLSDVPDTPSAVRPDAPSSGQPASAAQAAGSERRDHAGEAARTAAVTSLHLPRASEERLQEASRPAVTLSSAESVRREQSRRQNEIRERDLATLANPDAPSPQLTSALMRLATFRNPAARDQALAWTKDEDRKRQSISLRALAYYDEPSVNARLEELTHDSNALIRRQALLALAQTAAGGPREALLKNYLDAAPTWEGRAFEATPESLVVLDSLYRLSQAEEERRQYLERVLAMAEGSATKPAKHAAVRALQRMAPHDARVMQLSKDLPGPGKRRDEADR